MHGVTIMYLVPVLRSRPVLAAPAPGSGTNKNWRFRKGKYFSLQKMVNNWKL